MIHTPIRLLIIEDSEEDTLLMLRELRHYGYEPVYERVDTAEAMSFALDKQRWDVIVADYILPQFSGLAALRLLKEKGIDLPFILISGKIGEEIAVEAMRLGSSDYVMKDKLFRLGAAIERALKETDILRARKEAEDALEIEKARLSATLTAKENLDAIFSSLSDGVITIDKRGQVVLMNKRAEALTGWSQKESQGRSLREVFHIVSAEGKEYLENPADIALKTNTNTELLQEMILVARDGRELNIAAQAMSLRDKEGHISGVVMVFRDMTEKKIREEELRRIQKIESLGILAGGIAHDFNNILVSIVGGLSLLKMSAKPGDNFFGTITMIEKATIRAKDLARQLLTFSKGGSPIKKIVSIPRLLKETTNFSLRGSKVRGEFLIPDDLWPVEIDEGQISQVINNLVINADQAMPHGGVVQVRAENVIIGSIDSLPLKEGRYIKISVKDEGNGIPKEYLSKIFDPYFTTKEKGSGLGLAICYSIIRRHEGYITVTSEVGIGSTFYIYLPASEKTITGKRDANKKFHPGTGRILFMDDEEAVRDTAGAMLTYLGYEVEFAKDGVAAIELYKKAKELNKPFKVVIMDLTIPGGMGGKEAIKNLREFDPEVKVIVSSGYSNDPILSEYSSYGFSGGIVKPYEVEELGRVLATLIK